MSPARTVLDTDILSLIMRRDPRVIPRARTYLDEHGRFTFSEITRFEVLRGLHVKRAMRWQVAFEQLCLVSDVIPVTGEISRQGALIYADLQTRGALIGDADILIAATALVQGLTVTTNNESHYRRIGILTIDNWLHID